ncbi:MAG: hypothetical protein ACTSVF_03605 [Candidatus Asgardarchaeia archaeon]
MQWNSTQKEKIVKLISDELMKALEKPFYKGTPIWLNILYLLKLYNYGGFVGNLSMRLVGHTVYPFRIVEQELNLEEMFTKELDEVISLSS